MPVLRSNISVNKPVSGEFVVQPETDHIDRIVSDFVRIKAAC